MCCTWGIWWWRANGTTKLSIYSISSLFGICSTFHCIWSFFSPFLCKLNINLPMSESHLHNFVSFMFYQHGKIWNWYLEMNCIILLSCTGCLATKPNLHLSLLLYSCFLLCAILPPTFFSAFPFVAFYWEEWDVHLCVDITVFPYTWCGSYMKPSGTSKHELLTSFGIGRSPPIWMIVFLMQLLRSLDGMYGYISS